MDEKKWIEDETCYISTANQGSEEWHNLRRGAITMSRISYCVGRGNPAFTPPPEELALQICRIKKKEFTPEQIINMGRGTRMEPHVRSWDSKRKGVEIKEVGIGVWKKDPRFRGSMDGVISSDDFVEYKVPKRMYWKLMEKARNPIPNDYSHIFKSHYDQIIGNGVIHGKKRCCYTVISAEDCSFYQEWIPIDYSHWENVLYPKAVEFYEKYITPLMEKHNIVLSSPTDIP